MYSVNVWYKHLDHEALYPTILWFISQVYKYAAVNSDKTINFTNPLNIWIICYSIMNTEEL